MAGTGPAPKDRRSRDRDNKTLTDMVFNGDVYGDPLPEGVLPDEGSWHPQTVVWWESMRRWPLMEGEPEASWHFLVDTALMHHIMWSKGKWEFASEIRLREAKYGVMPDDRKRLGLKYVPASEGDEYADDRPPVGEQAVTDINSRRKRLT